MYTARQNFTGKQGSLVHEIDVPSSGTCRYPCPTGGRRATASARTWTSFRVSASISHRGRAHLRRPAIGRRLVLGGCFGCSSVMFVRGARRQTQAQAQDETNRGRRSSCPRKSHRPVVVALKCSSSGESEVRKTAAVSQTLPPPLPGRGSLTFCSVYLTTLLPQLYRGRPAIPDRRHRPSHQSCASI